MFDLGWGKLILIGIVALIVIGPKELPGALRTLGQWMTKIRRMASEFQNQFHEAMREAELADLKKDVDEMAATAQSLTNFNPVDDLRKDIESAVTPPADRESPLSDPNAPAASPPPASTTSASTESASTASTSASAISGDAPPAPAAPPPAAGHESAAAPAPAAPELPAVAPEPPAAAPAAQAPGANQD